MKVLQRYDYLRRDCKCDLECESCGSKVIKISAYDDDNFWTYVIPDRKCTECGESTNSLGLQPKDIATKYPAHQVV